MPDVVSIMRGSMDGFEPDTVGVTKASVPDPQAEIYRQGKVSWLEITSTTQKAEVQEGKNIYTQ